MATRLELNARGDDRSEEWVAFQLGPDIVDWGVVDAGV